jgi:hypothetical protein
MGPVFLADSHDAWFTRNVTISMFWLLMFSAAAAPTVTDVELVGDRPGLRPGLELDYD